MGSASGCEPEVVGGSSPDAGPRAASGSRPDRSAPFRREDMGSVASTSQGRSRADRLRRTQDFQRVLADGARSVRGPVTVSATPGSAGLRVGFASGRRMGGAVSRNRARRLLREAWRAVLMSNPASAGRSFDVVIVARPGLLQASGEEIRSRLTDALAELGVVGR